MSSLPLQNHCLNMEPWPFNVKILTLISLAWWAWWIELNTDIIEITLVCMINRGNHWPYRFFTLVSMINWGNHWLYRVYLDEHDKTEGITDPIEFTDSLSLSSLSSWTKLNNDSCEFTSVSMMNWGNQWLGINWGLTDPTELTLIRMVNSGITLSIELTLVSMINWGYHWPYWVYLGVHDKLRESLTLLNLPWWVWRTEGITESTDITLVSMINLGYHWLYGVHLGEHDELRESLTLLSLSWWPWWIEAITDSVEFTLVSIMNWGIHCLYRVYLCGYDELRESLTEFVLMSMIN